MKDWVGVNLASHAARLSDQFVAEDGADHGAEVRGGRVGRFAFVRVRVCSIDDGGGDDGWTVVTGGGVLGAEGDAVGGEDIEHVVGHADGLDARL